MSYLVIKAVVSGIIIALVSEVAKRSPSLGALIVSLPLVSILAVIWLWKETGDPERIASHMLATLWYVLPTLPMFVLMPVMLRGGAGFWTSLALACALTTVLYLLTVWVLGRFGVTL
ncbi:MAG: DUF3147 family protein [Pseudorhodoplanes sp.]|nr:MAG: DUF3147 family protein [Pseudorhodoplanes sp.]MBZ0140449.1 DUF3147 family protein [Pseudorhodoplanes sp.]